MAGSYEFTEEMGEISGFGGGYEATCRAMLKAGAEFWDAQPEGFDPKYQGMKNVYGLMLDHNEDAKKLDAAILAASGGGATGAMHHAVVSHLLFIRKNGWEAYRADMSKPEEEAPQ